MRNRDMPALAGQTLKMSAELPGVVDHIENHGLTKREAAAIAIRAGMGVAKMELPLVPSVSDDPIFGHRRMTRVEYAVQEADALFDELEKGDEE